MSLEAIVWVMRHSEATLGARLVLIVLAEHAHDDGTEAFPKVETISRKARMSRKAVQDALRRLEDQGHIVCSGTRPNGTRIYRLLGLAPGENPGEGVDAEAKMSTAGGVDVDARGEDSTPDSFDDPSLIRPAVEGIRETWGKHAPPLMAHRSIYFDSSRFASAVRSALRLYSVEDVCKAIENYAAVLSSPSHYWTHRYSAIEFLRRERATPGVEKFVDEADPLTNFRTKAGQDRDRDGSQQRTPAEQLSSAEAWILNTAWRLPLEEWDVAEQLGQRGVEGPDRTRLLDLWRSKRELAA